MSLKGKKIILGVTGSIAAYKTPHLVRLLVKEGAAVKVICTEAAGKFVSTLALSTVSRHEVLSNISDGSAWNNHVALGRWADVMLVAPCSANTLARLAQGICDNLLAAVYLSATCPVHIAPAMDEDMWHHPSTKNNLKTLAAYGNQLIPVGHGELASGLVGEGRMAEPEDLVRHLSAYFDKTTLPLSGKKALVTAGPTFERLDPVRYLGNFSTGKMGIALAERLAALGAEVNLVLGPTHLRPADPKVQVTQVESAGEMFDACAALFPAADIAIMAAAVADFRPKERAGQKIKKTAETLELVLEKNKDILAYLGSIKKEQQLLVGFALETHNEMEHARAKLQAKNADFIVLNSLQQSGAGFGTDTNQVSILGRDGSVTEIPLQSKTSVASAIISYITNDK
ncbi:MAG: bifunctional phosphopantothenoylcysteine decarboxylase/phosphopantothenate--cysteine ligase CoaBC [Chitinophagaceae bacterium]|nr:bifunctional phosphopantothenoylcysteine decarboxylase/phosphopantothenate--cysteine ligase CoaBC [Chitinophagaceae bacterium]